MTDEQRTAYLDSLLHDCLRYRSIGETGEIDEMLQRLWRKRPPQMIDDHLTLIEWLAQTGYDFSKHWPLPDRAKVVKYLEVVQRELRAIRAQPGPT